MAKSMAKGPPNSSMTARSRSSLNTETATKLSSKRNGTLLQQPARASEDRSFPIAAPNVLQRLNNFAHCRARSHELNRDWQDILCRILGDDHKLLQQLIHFHAIPF